MRQWISRHRSAVLAGVPLALATVLVVPRSAPPAAAAVKTVYIPARWASTGEVPWVQQRTKESANFILLWGDLAGTDPKTAPAQYRFDPDNVLSQLESLYSFYVNTMRFTPETGLLAQFKIDVIVTGGWSTRPQLNAWATGGSTDNKVGVINIAPGAALPGSWGLAHELGHVFQNYTFLGRSGVGLTDPSAGTFWETSAEFMAMQALPTTAAGDLTRFIRTENLYWSSSRHHYGNWMLMQYIKDRDGLAMFNRIWNEARSNEHPLEVYRRITGITQAELNRRVGEYAQHNVTWDYSNRATVMPFINQLYPFVTAYNGVTVEAVNQAAGHYRISDALAPSDYGYNKIRLVSTVDGGLIRLHLKGHAETGASGWTYGFVAVRNGTPRYGPLSQATNGELTFQTQPGERDVYLVVTATPTAVPHYAFLDGYPRNRRFPYEFRIDGAIPSGFEPGFVKPPAPGNGHWHSNGGGWVDNRANVAASAFVGPRAAVFGNSTVSGNARIEDLAWVNSGATVTGNAVVKGSALVQGGSNLSGNIVIGGDAEPSTACGTGTYLMFSDTRRCDSGPGEADVNPAHGTFTDAELAITGTTTPPTNPPTTTPAPPTTTPPPAGTGCTATYAVTSQWPDGFQADVTVRAGSAPITGWTVRWTFPAGTVTQSWNTVLTLNGSAVTAANVDHNGSLAAGASTTFGFIGSAPAATANPTPTCTAR